MRFLYQIQSIISRSSSLLRPQFIRISTLLVPSVQQYHSTMAASLTLGGKGSSLTSSSVYALANATAQVRIDLSVLDKLNSSSTNKSQKGPVVLDKYRIQIPSNLTLQESRAYLVVLLYKLLLSGNGGGCIRSLVPVLIAESLNSRDQVLSFEEIDVTGDERLVLEKSSTDLIGVCSMLDYQSSALCAVGDVAAALSCEALKADISLFNAMDSGDGFNAKDAVGVASDLKVLLNGSKLVGKVDYDSVSEIPRVNGSLREAVRRVHSDTRVELNSTLKLGKGGSGSGGTGKALVATVSSLATALLNMGGSSLSRVQLNLDAITDEDLKFSIRGKLPTLDSLKKIFNLSFEAESSENFIKIMHGVNILLGMAWEIVTWEAILAYFLIEGYSLEKSQTEIIETNGKVDKKSDKKKKVVLGKGTVVLVQLLKDSMPTGEGNAFENFATRLSSFLDPKDPGFDNVLKKVKEIVESNESRRLPKLPKGTRDFAKEQMAVREKAFSIISQVFKRHGATALDTPAFELRETLMGKYGEDSKLIFDLADQGGELCSLRYDLTVPFARYVAMNGLTSFKRYQIAKVNRRDNPSKGRYREFYQCDFDIAGEYETMGPDFEVIKVLTELLDELAIGEYEVKLNHRKLLDGMLEICGVPPEKFRTICSSIDKLDKMSFEQIKKEMVEEKGLSADTADMIGTFVKEKGSPLVLLSKLKQEGRKFLENKGSATALNELEILFKALEKSKCINKVVFDLSLARGLDYYTGVIYEAVFKGATQVGSIAAGGRYDNLIGMFGKKQVPAVGVSLGIERVFAIMEQIQIDQKQVVRATETEVLVSLLGDDLSQAAELVGELWDAGIKAEYGLSKRFSKHMDRAKDSKIPFMVLVGEREINEGIVKLKDIEANIEDTVLRTSLVEELKRRLASTSQ